MNSLEVLQSFYLLPKTQVTDASNSANMVIHSHFTGWNVNNGHAKVTMRLKFCTI